MKKTTSFFNFDTQTILLVILVIIGICYLLFYKNIESFTPYSYAPFDYMDTGSDPLTFYKYPVYRNPYMYPYKFYSSYPYPYMKHYEVNI
jgi:hypothetical protein